VNRREQAEEFIRLGEALTHRRKTRKLLSYYPDTGPLRRELYTKHTEFFAAGKTHLARAAVAANRVGKTTLSAFETTLHLTGRYPDWWPGRRFDRPVDWWAASDTGETTRDISQKEFLGKIDEIGTGMIPKDYIVGEPSRRRGVSDAVDTVNVRHISGGISTLAFKSYDQGRDKFQGTKKDGVSLDEEPPLAVYTECLTRLMATVPGQEDGTMLCTFTPLMGMSVVVLMFLNEPSPDRFVLTMGFDDAPHLSPESKAKLLAAFPPHERDARSKGIPRLGSGAIFPVPESEFIVNDFEIPAHWPRAYGMDVGWNRTAVPWGAINRDTDTVYLYSEHYRGEAEPSIHATAIKARGDWIPGVLDPAARGRSQIDGTQLVTLYKNLGLDVEFANNAVEAGIYEVWQRLSTGRLKVFKSMTNWLDEYRLYRRDEKGRIVKEKDHLMDATRYLIMSGLARAKVKPNDQPVKPAIEWGSYGGTGTGWMG
jgi:phage terminase large subunit-like protein